MMEKNKPKVKYLEDTLETGERWFKIIDESNSQIFIAAEDMSEFLLDLGFEYDKFLKNLPKE